MKRKLLIALFATLMASSYINAFITLSTAVTTCQSWDITKTIIDFAVAGGWTALVVWRVRCR